MNTSSCSRSRALVLGAAILLFLQILAPAHPAPSGTITAEVTSTALTPLENVTVEIVDTSGNLVANPPTDASGLVTIPDLAPGTYYARTYNSLGYINELYDGHPARSGNFAEGTPITVTEGGTEHLVFRLDLGGLITGVITDDATTDPIAGVWLDIYDDVGRHVGSTAQTDGTGVWNTGFGLPTGNYYVQTHNSALWVDELYNDVQSYNWVLDGAPVAVTIGETTNGIDIALELGAQVEGVVTVLGGPPLAGVDIAVMDASGRHRAWAASAADGTYTTGVVPTGTYYVRAWDSNGHIGKIYDDVVCVNCGITGGTPVPIVGGTNTTDINFELPVGGRISGTVTDAATTDAIEGVWIDIFDSAGRHMGSTTTTDASGGYITPFGLPTGTYSAYTNTNTAYVNEAYDNLPQSTPPENRASIEVTVGETTEDIDFALALGGRVSGTITEAGTGQPLAWAGNVTLYDSQGAWVTSTGLDIGGHYTTSGVPTGTYYVTAYSYAGHIPQIYDGVTCLNCGITGGTPVTVTAGATTSGIDFSMVRGGTIAGTITDAATTNGIAAVWVNVFDSTGRHVGSSPRTGVSGAYRTEFGLPAGSYYVNTNSDGPYVNEIYDDVPCVNCDVTAGELVPVTLGAATTGIDFALDEGGRISGRVTNADGGAGIAGVSVDFYDPTGRHVGASPYTDGSGSYTTTFGLPTGTYYAHTHNNGAFVNEAYDNLPIDTAILSRTPIAVTAGATTADIDFQLTEGGRIGGQVVAAGTLTPLAGVNVSFYDAVGQGVGGTSTDSNGHYLSSGLPAGTYYAKTERYGAYIMTLYDGTPFILGDVRTGTPISVTGGGATTSGIDFTLSAGGQIAGHVTNAAGGAPLANVNLYIADASGNFIWGWEQATDATGAYITTGLPAGTYYIRTEGSHAYVNEFYDNLPYTSIPTSTTPVTVTLGTVTPGIDFELDAGGFISGVVLAEGGGPVAGAGVSFYDSGGQYATGTGTDWSGAYVSPALPAGSYYVTTSNSGALLNEVYNNVPCFNCAVTVGALVPVTVGNTTPNINFALAPGGMISGRITNADGGAGLAGVWVDFFDGTGRHVGSSPQTDAGGYYTTQFGLPTGTYYAHTNNSGAFVNEAYDNLPASTDMASRTPITVTAGATTADINFQLTEGGRIAGTVVEAGTLTPLAGVSISFYDASGNGVGGTSTDSNGSYLSSGLSAGTYYAKTERYGAYIMTLYDGTPFIQGDVRTGTPISVTGGGATTSGIDFTLSAGGQIAGHVTNAAGGAPLANVSLYIADASGNFIWGWEQATDATGAYITTGLPAGTYYIRTAGPHAYVNEFYDNLPITTNPTSTTPVTVTLGTVTPGIDFQLAAGGFISGVVLAEGGGFVAGAGVNFYDSAGQYVDGLGASSVGAYVSQALPAGSYYVSTNNSGAFLNEVYDNVPCFNCAVTAGALVAVTVGNTTPGIDFALAPGGRISGRITNADGGAGIPGVRVDLQDSLDNDLGSSQQTDADGYYTTPFGLPTGTYYAVTYNNGAFIDEAYDNLPTNAPMSSRTPIAVTAGGTSSVNFQLSMGGRIGGTVVEAGTLTPLPNVNVSFFDASGSGAGGTSTDSNGNYLSSGLPAGTYYARAQPSGPHIRTLYPSTPCLTCDVRTGAPITVTIDTTTGDIDFALVRGGQIAGRITLDPGGAPLSGVNVGLFDAGGNWIGWQNQSDATGAYITNGLPAGTYYIRTEGTHAYVNEFYDNLPYNTNSTATTPVVVALDAVTPDIDFQLAPGGFISGTIVNADSQPVGGVSVSFYNSSNQYVGGTQTNSSGVYTSPALLAGSYYIRAKGPAPYIQILYPDIFCLNCNNTTGTAVPATVGATTPGIDMTLVRGGQIAGLVTDSVTALPLGGVGIALRDSAGNGFSDGGEGNTAADGTYLSRGLPTGTYYVNASTSLPYAGEWYNNLPPWTSATSSTPVTVTLGSVTGGINFALDPGGRISGRVTSAATGLGIADIWVYVYDASNRLYGTPRSNAAGDYVTNGLPVGTYYLKIVNAPGYIPELYDSLVCLGCSALTGTPVSVTAGNTTPGIDFSLEPGGTISGTITSNATGLGIANVYLELFNASGVKVANTPNSNASGQYTYGGLPAGTYYARSRAGTAYTNEVYDNLPIWTPTLSGAPITVTVGATATVDFGLDVNPGPNTPATALEVPIGLTEDLVYTAGLAPDTLWYKFFVPPGEAGKILKVNLRVTSPYPDPIPSGWASDLDFDLLDDAFKVRAIATSGSDNEFIYLPDVASGWYYIFMGYSSTTYADTNLAVHYDITVETGTDYGLGFITGRLLDSNGQGVEQVFVRVTAVPFDNRQVYYTVAAGPGGYFTAPTTPGPRALLIVGDGASSINQPAVNVVQEYYSDKKSLNEADHVWVAEGETADLGDITLAIGAIVTGRVTNGSGSPLSNAQIYGFTPDGYAQAFTSTNANGEYTLTGVPAGGAKIRFNRGQHAFEFYDDQATLGQAGILATVSGETIGNVDAVLTAGGTITGTVQNTSAAPIAAGVRLYSVLDSVNSRVSVTSNATTGAFTLSNVKPGQYKIQFATFSVGFAEEWYNDAADFASAQVITVTEGGIVSGINAQLVPAASEVEMSQGATPIATGGAYDYGSRMVNSDTDVVFSITNTGTGGLTFATLPFIVSGPDASQFPVAVQPAVPVLPGATSTITIRFRPTSAGLKTAYLSFGTNDADENPYIVNLTGTGITDPMVPVITWPEPAPILPGTPLTSLQLNAAADVPGTFKYTPDFGTVLPVGTHPLSVHFTPDDAVNYTTADASVSITVGPIAGGIAWSDFTDDLKSDVLWRHATGGDLWLWPMDGAVRQSETFVRTVADTDWEIRGVGDQTGDGRADLMWRHKVTGELYFWPMNSSLQPDAEIYAGQVDPAYDIVGYGDFNGDGRSDLLWRHTTLGDVWIWLMDGPARLAEVFVDRVDPAYVIKGVGDLDGDGRADIVWHHATMGEVWVWPMDGTTRLDQVWVGTVPDVGYQITAVADFGGDGRADLLWHHATSGEVWIWTMNGTVREAETWVDTVPDIEYRIVAAGDYDGDTRADILWHHATRGEVWMWLMDGPARLSQTWIATVPDVGYRIIR